MRIEPKPQNILSIESAVAGGSAALILETRNLVLKRGGSDACSRAEKIITVIGGLLDEGEVTLHDLDLIAVSTGPGSYSGIRIGVSTALGLARSAAIPCVGESVFDAMAYSAPIRVPFAVAIPVGKNDVAWQSFIPNESGRKTPRCEPELLPLSSFLEKLGESGNSLFAPTDLLQRSGFSLPDSTEIVDAGYHLAEHVGRLALANGSRVSRIQPIYLRKRLTGRPGTF